MRKETMHIWTIPWDEVIAAIHKAHPDIPKNAKIRLKWEKGKTKGDVVVSWLVPEKT